MLPKKQWKLSQCANLHRSSPGKLPCHLLQTTSMRVQWPCKTDRRWVKLRRKTVIFCCKTGQTNHRNSGEWLNMVLNRRERTRYDLFHKCRCICVNYAQISYRVIVDKNSIIILNLPVHFRVHFGLLFFFIFIFDGCLLLRRLIDCRKRQQQIA